MASAPDRFTSPPDARYHLLDAWRGLACLAVVVHHAGYVIQPEDLDGSLPRQAIAALLEIGQQGVTLFFVVSGYSIAASLDATRRRGESAWDFLRRRARRIYPPYWAALAVHVAVVLVFDALGLQRLHADRYAVGIDPPWKLGPAEWLANVTLLETLRPHVTGPPRNVYTAVAWSLCYEVQFYAVCALVLLVMRRRLFAGLLLVSALCLGAQAAARLLDRWAALAGSFVLGWEQFAAGLAVYWRLNRAPSRAAARLADALLLTLSIYGPLTDDPEMALATLFALSLILMRPLDRPDRWPSWLRTLHATGLRSYSIYLVHLPAVIVVSLALLDAGLLGFWPRVLVVIPIASAAGVAAGWWFFGRVEARFLNPPLPRP